jgi:hypothetical protein
MPAYQSRLDLREQSARQRLSHSRWEQRSAGARLIAGMGVTGAIAIAAVGIVYGLGEVIWAISSDDEPPLSPYRAEPGPRLGGSAVSIAYVTIPAGYSAPMIPTPC